MNLKGLPFQDSPHGAAIVGAITVVCTALLLTLLKMRKLF